MDLKTMEWIVNGLRQELESLQSEVKELKAKLNKLNSSSHKEEKQDDKLIDTKEVKKMLGVCYNTLQKIIREGKIKPIKMGPRNIRFWKSSIMTYLRGLQTN